MDFLFMMIPIVGFLVFLASLFSTKKGVTSTVVSILIPLGAIVGLTMSPSPETLFIILIIVSVLVYGGGRYWRNIEGFVKSRA
jgi:hypothetical protein